MITSFANTRRHARCRISSAEAGQPVLVFLTERFSYHTAGEWTNLIAENRILVNGKVVEGSMPLAPGDRLEYLLPDISEPPVNPNFSVVYEDETLLVLDKPGNLPMHPAGKFFQHTLWALLQERYAGAPCHFVNRLDRETSGLVLAARDAGTCSLFARALKAPDACKEYLAIVEGACPDCWVAEGCLQRHAGSVVRKKKQFVPGPADGGNFSGQEGKRVKTIFSKVGGNDHLSLVRARLGTGRTHQIRASLEAAGCPLTGDKMYGLDETVFLRFIASQMTPRDRDRMRMDRQALHAYKLAFRHPLTGKPCEWCAEMPPDMTALLRAQDLPFAGIQAIVLAWCPLQKF